MIDLESIEFEKNNYIGTIKMNRPEKLNTFDKEMNRALRDLVDEINDDDKLRVIVITGTGEKAFCAGSDLNSLDVNASFRKIRNRDLDYTYVTRLIRKPVIAMIRGYAVGGGLELCLMADIRYASKNAVFGAPEIKHGWVAGGGSPTFLPRIVGYGQAMKLILTGKFIDAAQAEKIGLVEGVFPDERLEEETYELAETIAEHSPLAVELAKRAVRMSLSTPPEISMHYENELFSVCFTSEDAKEGIAAFQEKRKPNFNG